MMPADISAKSRATKRFLMRKQAEYERQAQEIEILRQEVESSDNGGRDAP